MKTVMTTFILCLLTILSYGQSTVTIEYQANNSVLVNKKTVDNTTTYDEIVKMFGTPILYKAYKSGKKTYHYKILGLSVHIVDDKLLALGINLNWDGDKTFPEETFEGTFTIGGTTINSKTKLEAIEKIEGYEIKCPIPVMCMNNPRGMKNPILIGFKEEIITQALIEFH